MADQTPKPAASPKDPNPEAGDEASRHDTAELPVTKGEMRRSFRMNEVYTVLVAVLTAAGALIGGYKLFISEARAAGEEVAKNVKERQDKLEAAHSEVRADVRDLYKAVMYGRRSERLEAPVSVKDGGP